MADGISLTGSTRDTASGLHPVVINNSKKIMKNCLKSSFKLLCTVAVDAKGQFLPATYRGMHHFSTQNLRRKSLPLTHANSPRTQGEGFYDQTDNFSCYFKLFFL